MGITAEKLTKLIDAPNRFEIPFAQLRAAQVEAANERFQERRGPIKLLTHRAEEAQLNTVEDYSGLVPLLFAHTTYKSYTEGWLAEQKWDRMSKWLSTLSTHRISNVDLTKIRDIDDWIMRLEAAGHYVSCSSGTTGKSAMLNASPADMDWCRREVVTSIAWGCGMLPNRDRRMFGLAPIPSVPRNQVIRGAMVQAFADPSAEPFAYPMPPITIGSLTAMVTLRKRIADGTAKPAEIASFDATSAARQEMVTKATTISAEALVEARKHNLFLSGMWASLHKVAEAVRALGFSAKDFRAENTLYVGGGLKGAMLPPDYREYVFDTFNLRAEHVYQMYGMQEIHSSMPRCKAGHYHVPPWLICLPLDRAGEQLLTMQGEVEGRAAFMDLSVDGRWGGVISGDKIVIDYNTCACGNGSPSIRDNITRYSDLAGGDKISCTGTIDAYVRGVT